jgi:hypothetical protein
MLEILVDRVIVVLMVYLVLLVLLDQLGLPNSISQLVIILSCVYDL